MSALTHPHSRSVLFRSLLAGNDNGARAKFVAETSVQYAIAVNTGDIYGRFLRIDFVDPNALLGEIESNSDLFGLSTRQSIREQQHTEAIFLRRPNYDRSVLKSNFNLQDTIATKHSIRFPLINDIVAKLAAQHGQGTLGLISIVRLQPGMSVYPHFDRGLYYAVRDRYHLVLESEGSEMCCDGETRLWQPGELWWFNNKLTHSARNPGKNWRTHIIFDVLPAHNIAISEEMREWAEIHHVE